MVRLWVQIMSSGLNAIAIVQMIILQTPEKDYCPIESMRGEIRDVQGFVRFVLLHLCLTPTVQHIRAIEVAHRWCR